MTHSPTIARRRVLQLLVGGVVSASALPRAAGAAASQNVSSGPLMLGDQRLLVAIDPLMRTRLLVRSEHGDRAITAFSDSETLHLSGAQGGVLTQFHLVEHRTRSTMGLHGPCVEHEVIGRSADGLEKALLLTFPTRYPGIALMRVRFTNNTGQGCKIAHWAVGAHTLPRAKNGHGSEPAFWSFSGASHEDRRDWVQPVHASFKQRNFMGMNASDYGGGTPVIDVWRRDIGLGIGHLETRPHLVAMPIEATSAGARLAIEAEHGQTLAAGESFETIQYFLHAHQGDYFVTLDRYRQLMAERGLKAPMAPESAFAPIWCAWGYERNFTIDEVEGTLDKARDMGFEWVVLDDGWQTTEGDWYVDQAKFPRAGEDMQQFAQHVKKAGMKPRLWFSPLAVNPGTDLLHDHVDMLLLDKNGATHPISWWNAFYLCPAYQPTVDYHRKLVRRIIGEWGYEGLKLDGQHLNGVAPCYNPAHHHARPEESVEKLQDFWQAIYEAALEQNPQAVVELCPCGTSFAFHNVTAMNQTPASDPESSWQVRHKGKTIKALLGPGASYAGDHVELSDRGRDFASTIGVGAVVSTKFTWPADTPHPTAPQPAGGYLLTPEKESLWRHWVGIYRDKMLPKGTYLGALYDIGFDKPEAHVIEKDGSLYYAFFAKGAWSGTLDLRGLSTGSYSLKDYVTGKDLGLVSDSNRRVRTEFTDSLLLEARLLS